MKEETGKDLFSLISNQSFAIISEQNENLDAFKGCF